VQDRNSLEALVSFAAGLTLGVLGSAHGALKQVALGFFSALVVALLVLVMTSLP
jgi:hypothetical protein